jgi:3,5-epimerase/4-reductase
MKFYILGGTGFMGGQFAQYLRNGGHEVSTEKIDLTDYPSLNKVFQAQKPEVVVNFAGVRAQPHVDWCEDHKLETSHVNVAGAINAMTAALNAGAYPIQIASGCVYEGGPERVYKEEDTPNFTGSYYSRMRISLQDALKELPVLYARIRMPVSMFPHDRNFITKITSYKKVINVPNSMTLLEDLWPALVKISELRPTGILNLTNEGWIDHKMVLDAYKEIVDPNHTYEPISLEDFDGANGFVKARRSNCVLDMTKAKSLGIDMPAMDQARLREIMQVYKQGILNIK